MNNDIELDPAVGYIPAAGEGVQLVLIISMTGKKGVEFVIGPDPKGKAALRHMPLKEFEAQHFVLHTPIVEVANEILIKCKAVAPDVLGALEKVINMKTEGKSAEAIRAEVLKYAAELPAQHPLKAVPKKYPDRQSAIAALTATRAAHFAVTQPKEKVMSKKVKTAAAATETKAAATPAPAAAAPAKAEAAPAKAPAKNEAKKGSGKADAKTAAPAAVTATPAAEKLAAGAKVKAKAAGRKSAVNLDGPFKIGPKAEKAKTPEELRLHEGSARYAMMQFVLGSKKKSFTVDELKAIKGVGDQCKQALSGMVRYEYLCAAQ